MSEQGVLQTPLARASKEAAESCAWAGSECDSVGTSPARHRGRGVQGCHGDCDEYEVNAGSAAHRRKGETAKGKIAEASGAEIVLGYMAGPKS